MRTNILQQKITERANNAKAVNCPVPNADLAYGPYNAWVSSSVHPPIGWQKEYPKYVDFLDMLKKCNQITEQEYLAEKERLGLFPDLIVESITGSIDYNPNYYPGIEMWTIKPRIKIKNLGEDFVAGPAGDYTKALQIAVCETLPGGQDFTYGGGCNYHYSYPSIKKGESFLMEPQDLAEYIYFSREGTYEIRITVDNDNKYKESNEENNLLIKTINIKKYPIGTIFTTRSTYSANLGGISGADAKCQESAQSAALAGTWIALISDRNSDFVDKIPNTVYKRIDGEILANNKERLFEVGSQVRVNLDEFGNEIYGYNTIWTGSQVNGRVAKTTLARDCSSWQSTESSASVGRTDRLWGGWISAQTTGCAITSHLYCMKIN